MLTELTSLLYKGFKMSADQNQERAQHGLTCIFSRARSLCCGSVCLAGQDRGLLVFMALSQTCSTGNSVFSSSARVQ